MLIGQAFARGVRVVRGSGEDLPYARQRFGAAVMVATLAFVADPAQVVYEAARVLRPGAVYVAGIINAKSAWGEAYERLGRQGDPVFGRAQFLTPREATVLAEAAGFVPAGAWSALLESPGAPLDGARAVAGAQEGAGFVALGFRRRTAQ